MKCAGGIFLLAWLLIVPCGSSAQGTLADGYARVKPALVKVWAFNASGVPIESGTGFVVQSDARHSWIVTALHVVMRSTKVKVDVSRELRDLPATIVARSSKHQDIALLQIARGGLAAVHFAPKAGGLAEGDSVAAAGYFKYDEQIGVAGQSPRLVGPGTIGALPDGGRFIEVNLNLEPGLSGAPVFDPATGDVVGVIETKSTVGQSGYAVSVPLVVLGFLGAHHVAVDGGALPKRVAEGGATAAPVTPKPRAAPAVAAPPASRFPAVSIPVVPVPAAPAPASVARVPATAVAIAPAPEDRMQVPPPPARDAVADACLGGIEATPQRVVPACTRLLAAGAVTGPDLKRLYFNRSQAYGRQGQYALAVGDLNQVLSIDPNDAVAYNDRGFAYVGEGRYEEGIADLTRALRIDPRYAVAYYNRGSAYGYSGRYELAIADLTQALLLDSNSAVAYNRRGAAYNSLGKYELAIADLTHAVWIDPNYALAYTYRGNAYSGEGRYPLAIADYDCALRIDPNSARAYTGRGHAYEQVGRNDLALADYNQAVRIDPSLRGQILRVSQVYGR